MCFSFEVSLATFIISWTISLYLLNKDLNTHQRNNVIFLLIFSSIQLADSILWYINMKKNSLNYFVTSFVIPTILSLQILHNIYIRNNNKNIFIDIFSIFFCIYLFYKLNGYSIAVCENKFSSPVWGSNEIKLWEILIFCTLITWPAWDMFLYQMFILVPFIYIFANGAYGSLWCFFANITAFFCLYHYS